MKPTTIFLILGATPLPIYPFIALAGVMSLAGHPSGDAPFFLVVVSKSFLIGSLAYPLVYFACVGATRTKLAQKESRAAFCFSVAPLAYLVLVGLLFGAWMNLNQK